MEANKYLSSYSRLMRNILENSNKDFTPLSTELEQLKELACDIKNPAGY
ncbi:hypothetical protein [Parabacteroides timonensis]|nr:hypothetical protein [Parabacteroides timonensis]